MVLHRWVRYGRRMNDTPFFYVYFFDFFSGRNLFVDFACDSEEGHYLAGFLGKGGVAKGGKDW